MSENEPPMIDAAFECSECGRPDDGVRGWTLRLDTDDQPVAFCPGSDLREFG